MQLVVSNAPATELAAMATAWRALAADWGLSWRERRSLFPAGGDDMAEPPADTETRMRILLEIGYRLRIDDPEELYEWLREPSELWRWHAPLEVMGGALSGLRRFRQFVEQGLGQ